MLSAILFFVIAFGTLAALLWSGIQIFRQREDPLRTRLDELQATALVSSSQIRRRWSGGGFLNGFLFIISLVPGMDNYLRDTEKELAQAGIRRKQALAAYVF